MSIGFSELIVIIIVAMLFISPKKLSKAAFSIGQLISKFSENKEEIVESISSITKDVSEVTQPIKDVIQPINELKEEIKSSINSTEHNKIY